MRAEHINVGDELYYAATTKTWRHRPTHSAWGRAVVTGVGKHHNATYVMCDITMWRWNADARAFEPSPTAKTGCRVAVRYFRGPWRQTFDMTNAEAVAHRIAADEYLVQRDKQRREDKAVAERARLIGLDVSHLAANGRIVVNTSDMATILDHLALHGVTFHNG